MKKLLISILFLITPAILSAKNLQLPEKYPDFNIPDFSLSTETKKNIVQQQSIPINTKDCLECIHKSTQPVCFIRPGFRFEAALVTSIFSFNTLTPVVAEVEYDILHLGQVIFPKGTEIIGDSQITKTTDRVNVKFHTISYPNGRYIKFNGLALHTDGSAGIPGLVKKEKATVTARVLLKTAGAATIAATQQPAAGQMIESISDEVSKELSEKETTSITIKKGVALMIYIEQEIPIYAP